MLEINTYYKGHRKNKKKPPCGGFFKFEDAKVGLLVSFLAFLQIRNLSTTYLNPSSNLFLYRATWHSTPDSFRVPRECSCNSTDLLSLLDFAPGSASCVHRPQHWRRLGPPFAGRLSTSELVGVEAFASRCNVFLSSRKTKCFR